MLKVLRFLFGGEPLFGNSPKKSMFRNLEVNKGEIIPNVNMEQPERTHRKTITSKYENEIGQYSKTDSGFGYRGKLENMNTKQADEPSGMTKKSNHNDNPQYQKQKKHFD